MSPTRPRLPRPHLTSSRRRTDVRPLGSGRPGGVATVIERIAIVIAAFALAVGVILLLSGGLLAGRDTPAVSGHGSPAPAGPVHQTGRPVKR